MSGALQSTELRCEMVGLNRRTSYDVPVPAAEEVLDVMRVID